MSNSKQNDRKRQRPKDPQPAFFDATASVSASQFGARRLPEIKDLWYKLNAKNKDNNAAVNVKAFCSGGRKTSSRHLRRRATSHKPRKRYRRFDGKNGCSSNEASLLVPKSRRARRQNITLLQNEHGSWRHSQGVITGETESCFVDKLPATPASDKPNWIMTHIWHAKRFRMKILWGWNVPIIHSNRGAAAALRLVAREGKCLLQDVTYRTQPIWFKMSKKYDKDRLTSLIDEFQKQIKRVIPDFTVDYCDDRHAISGEAMAHGVDCFPKAAIGPVIWMQLARPLNGNNDHEGEGDNIYFYFFVHLSIQETIIHKFAAVVKGFASDEVEGPFYGVEGGVAYLQLRGKSTALCLCKAIQSNGDSRLSDVEAIERWMQDKSTNSLQIHHGSVLQTTFLAKNHSSAFPLFLRSVSPRDPALSCNRAVCGMDLICVSSQAKELFLSLVNSGGACPIGIAEEAFLSLECDPPLPVFPRDYPDTEQGTSYWDLSSDDWNYIRRQWEGGGGVIPSTEQKECCMHWPDLTKHDNSPSTCPVIVRGSFSDPFQNALTSSGAVPVICDTIRRNRRSMRSPRFYKEAQLLSKHALSVHQKLCHSLREALSLPALLVCHVQVSGKGTLKPGLPLYSMKNTDEVIAIVTAGAFSISRGRCHGLCIAAAAHFLEAVATTQHPVVVQRLDGRNELQLKIRPKISSQFREGTLTLLANF